MIKLQFHQSNLLGKVNVTRKLVENRANINILTKRGQSALHYAAEKGDELNVAFLIENGANLNIMDKFGKTPLHYAAQNGNESVTEMLVKSGAVVDVTDYANKKPIQYAVYGSNHHKLIHYTEILYVLICSMLSFFSRS